MRAGVPTALRLSLLGALGFLAFLALSTAGGRGGSARAAEAQACAAEPLGTAQSFGLFVHGAYGASGTSVQGRVAVGGDATINSYAVGTGLSPSSSRADLIVGGSLSVGGSGAQAPNGSVTYDKTLSGTITTPNGALKQSAPPFDFDEEFSSLEATSTTLAGVEANGTAEGPSYAFVLTGTSSTTNVFTIAASELQHAQVIDIHVPLKSSTLVNVTGGSYSSAAYPTATIQFWNGSNYVQAGQGAPSEIAELRDNLLWNFPTATSVQIGPNIGWPGTILAPRAAVTFQSGTDLFGTLIAGSMEKGGGTAWNNPYSGCIPKSDLATSESSICGPAPTGGTSPAPDITLLTSTLPQLNPGETAWVSTLWRGACVNATEFELTASGPPGINITYPTNTGAFSSFYKASTLLQEDTDYAALKIAVGNDVTGNQTIALTAHYELASGGNGQPTTRNLTVTLPVVANSGPAVEQVTNSVGPIAAGSAEWVSVSYKANAPGVTNAKLTVSAPEGASVIYPGEGSSTSFNSGADLAVDETDFARFRLDTGSLTAGSYKLGLELTYGSGSHLSGSVTLEVS